MKNKVLLFSMLLSILLIPSLAKAQYTFEGTVVDIDTKQPIACANIWIWYSSDEVDLDTNIRTNTEGYFKLVIEDDNATDVIISFEINKDGYRTLKKKCDNQGGKHPKVYELYSYDSDNYKIEDIAKSDYFDLTFGFDLYSPSMDDSDDKFKSVFSFNYGYEGKAKLTNRMQLGFRYVPLKVKWMAMNSDTSIVTIAHDKERYFEASTSFGIYTRFIFSTAGAIGHRGLFLDVGANYSLPYYFSYTYFTEDHIKTSQNKIRKFNDFQAMMRLGFYWGSIRATYRFTDVMKDDFVESPKLTLGVEFNIPAGEQ